MHLLVFGLFFYGYHLPNWIRIFCCWWLPCQTRTLWLTAFRRQNCPTLSVDCTKQEKNEWSALERQSRKTRVCVDTLLRLPPLYVKLPCDLRSKEGNVFPAKQKQTRKTKIKQRLKYFSRERAVTWRRTVSLFGYFSLSFFFIYIPPPPFHSI